MRVLAVMGALLAVLGACSRQREEGSVPPREQFDARSCPDPELSEPELVERVNVEMERRFGQRPSHVNSEIKITRDGCDYLYLETSLPARPGGSFMVVFDPTGRVKDYVPGV